MKGKKKKKMYYSSYLVMVAARNLKKKKMQTAYLFRQLSRFYSYCSKEKDDFFLKSFPF